jgi:ubiquinone/menaquinone biosynthesis C-methylase UbiE
MTLHPLATQFASIADAYERGRPDYAPAVVDSLSAELGLAPGARVLDLGAGTGKLTRALLAAGLDVVAVEPQDALRALLAERVGAERAISGLAEAIPLPDGSVEAVTVADAFHWFDRQASLAEIRRVLRPGGGLAVLNTAPDWRGASWAHELGTLLRDERPAHPHFDGPSWQQAVRTAGGWSEPREVRVTTTQPLDRERIVDYLTSMSWIAALEEPARGELLERVRTMLAAGTTPEEQLVHFVIGLTSPL